MNRLLPRRLHLHRIDSPRTHPSPTDDRLGGLLHEIARSHDVSRVSGTHTHSMTLASYDLTWLRRIGLIIQIDGRIRYRLTDDGLAFAIFYSNLHYRVL
jgi:hypothetical protein